MLALVGPAPVSRARGVGSDREVARGRAGSGLGPGKPAVEREFADPDERLLEALRGQAPLRRALAHLAARLVETTGWDRLGFARLGDYARERLGLSARQVQDLAHVDAALTRLPAVERALLSHELSWSKARLTPHRANWIDHATRVSVRRLEDDVDRAIALEEFQPPALTPGR